MEDYNTAPFLLNKGMGFQYFQSMEKAWADPEFGITQYLGKVRIQFDKNSNQPNFDTFDLFVNKIQFFDAELDFD